MLLVVVAVAPLRTVNLLAGLPARVAPDEPTVVERALAAAAGDLAPPAWDWPPASSYLLAATLVALRAVAPDALAAVGGPYAVGRVVFAVVALLAVALCGFVGAALAGRDRDRLWVGVGSATAFGVSYLSVRLGRGSHPEHLQLVFMLGSFLATAAYDRRRRGWALSAAGLLAGLAGATKYLGVLMVLPAAAAVVCSRGRSAATLRGLTALGGSTIVGILAGTAATVLDWPAFWSGFSWQLAHQAGGHLGYEADTSGWVFHLTLSLPGTWGWPLTLLSLLGVVLAVVRGTRLQRLALTALVPLLGFVGTSNVRFPHYALVVTPFLAAFGMAALARLARAGGPVVALGVTGAVAASLGVVVLDDVRLVRSADAADTRVLATRVVAALPGPVWSEGYGVTAPPPSGWCSPSARTPRCWTAGATRCSLPIRRSAFAPTRPLPGRGRALQRPAGARPGRGRRGAGRAAGVQLGPAAPVGRRPPTAARPRRSRRPDSDDPRPLQSCGT